jgi:hypothetical protein
MVTVMVMVVVVIVVIVVIMIRYVSTEVDFYLAASRQTDTYEIAVCDL